MGVSDTASDKSSNVKQNAVYLALALFIVAFVFILLQIVKLLNKPSDYMLAQNGRITNYEEAIAYIIRDEEVLDTSEYKGKREAIILDANRVAKGGVIANYIGNDDASIDYKINEIDNKIQSLMETLDPDYSQEVKNYNKTIEDKLYDLIRIKNNIENIKAVKEDILSNMENRASQIGKNADNSELKQLLKDRADLEKEQSINKTEVIADKAGLVSYRIDGYESILDTNSFTGLRLEKLSNIKYVTNQIIPISEDKVKIINSFYMYLAVVADSEESKAIKLNDIIKISFDGDFSNYEKATVEYIANENDKRVIVLKTNKKIEEFSKYRKINIDLIWSNYEGIKVPDEVIHQKNIFDLYDEGKSRVVYNSSGDYVNLERNINYVKVLGVTGYEKDVFVKVENSAKGYSIISNYEDDELLELGISEEIVKSRSKLNIYDKIVTT